MRAAGECDPEQAFRIELLAVGARAAGPLLWGSGGAASVASFSDPPRPRRWDAGCATPTDAFRIERAQFGRGVGRPRGYWSLLSFVPPPCSKGKARSPTVVRVERRCPVHM